MIVTLHTQRVQTLEQVRHVAQGTEPVDFAYLGASPSVTVCKGRNGAGTVLCEGRELPVRVWGTFLLCVDTEAASLPSHSRFGSLRAARGRGRHRLRPPRKCASG